MEVGDGVESQIADNSGVIRFYRDYADYRPSFAELQRFAVSDDAEPITDDEILTERDEILALVSAT